jgi:integrase
MTFDINRIKDLALRESYALDKLNEVNAWLRSGHPELLPETRANVIQGINLALEIKFTNLRENSKRGYRSVSKSLIGWLQLSKYDHLDVSDISKSHALQHMDYLLKHNGIQGRTYNNRLIHLKAIWNELIERGFSENNPWAEIKKKREADKARRPMRKEEVDVIFPALFQHNKYLALAVLFIYYTMIRPVEIQRMKIGMIHLADGIITLPPDVTKNHKRANITMPEILKDWIQLHFDLDKFPKNYFAIGEDLHPSPNAISPNKINKLHKRITVRLQEQGKLSDITGIQLYSWKDTGVKKLLDQGVNIVDIMNHLRHSDLNVTQKYCTSLKEISPEILYLNDTIPGITT